MGPPDDTVERVRRADPRLSLRVRVWQSPHRGSGPRSRWNAGLALARGRLRRAPDHDDLWLPSQARSRHVNNVRRAAGRRRRRSRGRRSSTSTITSDRGATRALKRRGRSGFRQLPEGLHVIGPSSVAGPAAVGGPERAGSSRRAASPLSRLLDLILRLAFAPGVDSIVARCRTR